MKQLPIVAEQSTQADPQKRWLNLGLVVSRLLIRVVGRQSLGVSNCLFS